MNRVILMGRLVRDVEQRTTQSGLSTCSFTVAVDRKYKGADGQKQTDFINCVAWRQTAEFICKYFSKGNRILLNGSIQTRTWDDQDGKKHYATEVLVEDVEFCESKRNASTDEAGYNDGTNDSYIPLDEDDEGVPF